MRHLVMPVMASLLFFSCSKDGTNIPAAPAVPGSFAVSVSISPAGSGSVQKSPDAGTYVSGTSVALLAIPASGYAFMYWSGDANGNNPSIAVIVDTSKSLTAVFAQPDSMAALPGGTFLMGTVGTPDSVHAVTISPFRMGRTEVTQVEYQRVMSRNPSSSISNPLLPVENVSWYDAVLYCNQRSRLEGKDTVYSFSDAVFTVSGCDFLADLQINYGRNGYRLPTEAEWEYACRAGTTTDYYWGGSYPPTTNADTAAIHSNAVWYYSSNGHAWAVASKMPNGWGLYDMSGNVWEWVNDCYESYSAGAQTDPIGPSTAGTDPGSNRVLRGGSWSIYVDGLLRSAARSDGSPDSRSGDIGFRLASRP